MIRPGRQPRTDSDCHSAHMLTPPEGAAERMIKGELEMNYQRYQQLVDGLTGIARKVLAYVPVSEAWGRPRIASEIERQSRARVDPRTLDGVLDSLVEHGLVKEPKRGQFRRIVISEPPRPVLSIPTAAPSAPAAPTHQEKPVSPKPSTETPIDKIAQATSSLRKLAKQIADISTEIEDAAIAEQQESQKMRQLSDLLKSIHS